MYQPSQQDFTNLQAWQNLLTASLFLGPIPAAPSVMPTGEAALAPLPAGIVFSSAVKGAVKFTTGVNNAQVAAESFYFIGALPSLAQGSPEYAETSWNCQTAKFEEEVGLLIATANLLVPTKDSLTGAVTYGPDPTGKKVSPDVYVIPSEYDTVEKALEFLNNPAVAKALYDK